MEKIEYNTDTLRIFRYRQKEQHYLHCHQFLELAFVESGNALHEINKRSYILSKNDVVFINEGDFHRYTENRTFTIWNVLIPRWLILREFDRLISIPGIQDLIQPEVRLTKRYTEPVHLPPSLMKSILVKLRKISISLKNSSPASELIAQNTVISIIAEVADHYRKNTHRVLNPALPPLIIRQSIAFLRKADKTPSISELAKSAELSVEHFIRIFKKYTGVPPLKYFLRLRIEKAVEIFSIYPDRTVTEVAGLCGFDSGSYFSEVFKKITGLAPVVFRGGNRQHYVSKTSILL